MTRTTVTRALMAREHAAESLAQLDKAIRELDAISREICSPVTGQFEAHATREKLAIVAMLTRDLASSVQRIADRSRVQ